MLEIADGLRAWCERGEPFAVATVAAVHGSAPRRPGAAMAVDAAGSVLGSVSGGCVESEVYELCRAALDGGTPGLHRFGYDDDSALGAGLTCGGSVEVFVQRIDPARPAPGLALRDAAARRPVALVRIVAGPARLLGRALAVRAGDGRPGAVAPGTVTSGAVTSGAVTSGAVTSGAVAPGTVAPGTVTSGAVTPGTVVGTLGERAADRAAVDAARALLRTGRTRTVLVPTADGPATALVEVSAPAPRLLIFGSTDFAVALAPVGAHLGYRVTVCDARPVFTTADRFPGADEVVVAWPDRYLRDTATDERTAVCVLTHDLRFDVPLLRDALRMPLGYVGAMGSRRTHGERMSALRAEGLTEAELGRLHSPIGLDLNACSPEETAVSIVAEIIAHRNGATATPLGGSALAIHREPARS
ncbi:XdhC family protein [Kitasatospora sp. NPDC097691]|uniref:XdhC family protein n=1 Tax=Kitasatospora sp. NPDC097691 TaxID=3157231 RepID=UPI0033340147